MCNTFVSNILSKKEKKKKVILMPFNVALPRLSCEASRQKGTWLFTRCTIHRNSRFQATQQTSTLVGAKTNTAKAAPWAYPFLEIEDQPLPKTNKLLQSQHHSSGVPTETSSLHNPTSIPKSSHIHPALHEPRLKNTSLYEKQLDAFSGQQFIFFPFRSGFPCNMHQNCVEARAA